MSDAVVQAIVTGVFAVIVALLGRELPKRKEKPARAGAPRQEGAAVSAKARFARSPLFVWLIAPVIGAAVGLGLFHAGVNGVEVFAGAGPVPLRAPFPLGGYYVASGFMGEGDKPHIGLNAQWTDGCHAAPTCMKFTFSPQDSWAGVYWQSPPNNWGDQPGRKIEGAKRLVFWARGGSGGELVSFKCGGIQGKKFQDSLEKAVDPSPVMLTNQWRQYEIDLGGADTHSVIGAFSWSATRDGNPNGATFYLEGITIE